MLARVSLRLMVRRRLPIVLVGAWAATLLSAQQPGSAFRRQVIDNGIAIEFSMQPVADVGTRPLREGDDVDVRFKLAYADGGAPLEGVFPTGWIQRSGDQKRTCNEIVARILNAGLNARPDVNLNNYYVLALNHDATISVVDPLFG